MAERERRYGEREVGEILRLATRRQADSKTDEPGGLTLGELQRIAGEVGIDERHIREAAEVLDANPGLLQPKATQIELSGEIDWEIDQNVWEDILLELRRTIGGNGTVTERGRVWEWSGDQGGTYFLHVSAHRSEGRTRLRLMAEYSGLLVVTWIVAAMPLLGAAGFLGSLAGRAAGLGAGWAVGIGSALALILGAHALIMRYAAGHGQKLRSLMERIQEIAARRSPREALAESRPLEAVESESTDLHQAR